MKTRPHLLFHNQNAHRLLYFFCVFTLSLSSLQAQFTDVTDLIGEHYTTEGSFNGHGFSFYDFNQDGWDDLTISQGTNNPVFYLNQQGTFVTADINISNITEGHHIIMMVWADFNGDELNDLILSKSKGPVELWINQGNGLFTETASQAGFYPGNYLHKGIGVADYDHDGCLDVFIAKFYYENEFSGEPYQGKLYRGNCDGTFNDVTTEAGVQLPSMLTFQPVFLDYNADGWEDLLLVNDRLFCDNHLFMNNGDGTFSDVSVQTGAGVSIEAMTGSIGDYNNDAFLDIYHTNSTNLGNNFLLQNQNGQSFINVASETGTDMNQLSWGAVWLDQDNDSWLDLFVSVTFPSGSYVGNEFFLNNQGQAFSEGRAAMGLSEEFSDTYTTARGDINNDGYFDFGLGNRFTHPFVLYQNNGGNNNYLSVSLQGSLSNFNGIGTWLHCYAGGQHYVRYTICGENLTGQNSGKEIFGLGNLTTVDSLVIEWNRGTSEVYYEIPVNQHLNLVEGASFMQNTVINLGEEFILCPGDSVVLDAGEFHSYLWNTGDTTQTLTVTEPGQYQVEVSSEFGITATSNWASVITIPEPEISFDVTHVLCAEQENGSISLSVSTFPLEFIEWSNGITDTTFLSNLTAGLYSFFALDSAGCAVQGAVSITEPAPLLGEVISVPAQCFGDGNGSASANIIGGTPPYAVDWGGFNPEALAAGSYSMITTDQNGCELVMNFEITEPDSLWFSLTLSAATESVNGSALATPFGGTPPYSIVWSTGETNSWSINDLLPGEYSAVVEDLNGCQNEQSFQIETSVGMAFLTEQDILVFPNPASQYVSISCCPTKRFHLEIFDLSGKLQLSESQFKCPGNLQLDNFTEGLYLVRLSNENEQYHFRLAVSY